MNDRIARAEDNHPGERIGDEGARKPSLWGFLRRYVLPATFWSFAASVVAVISLIVGLGNQDSIQRGRRNAIRLTCAVESAVSDQGRIVLAQAGAKSESDEWGPDIARKVQMRLGSLGAGVVRSDGSLDCDAFQRVARTR